MTTQRKCLTNKQVFQLASLTLAEYVASGQTDVEFAVYASEKLGTTVNARHIASSREIHGIESKRAIAVAANKVDAVSLESRLADAEAQSKHLAERVNQLSAKTEQLALNVRILIEFAQSGAGGSKLQFHLGKL